MILTENLKSHRPIVFHRGNSHHDRQYFREFVPRFPKKKIRTRKKNYDREYFREFVPEVPVDETALVEHGAHVAKRVVKCAVKSVPY